MSENLIKIRYIDVEKDLGKIKSFNNPEVCKYKKIEDQRLAYASIQLKGTISMKYYSISHSYPYVAIAECDKPIGCDIEFINRGIKWRPLLNKHFAKDEIERICDRDHFIHV